MVPMVGRDDEEHPARTSTPQQASRARAISRQASLSGVPSAHVSASWEMPPAVLIAAALSVVLFAQAFLRVRARRPEYAPWTRALLFGAGLALLVLPIVSPLDEAGDERLLSAHMLQHVLIGDAAVALLGVAVGGPLVFFLPPPAVLRPPPAVPPPPPVPFTLPVPPGGLAVWG